MEIVEAKVNNYPAVAVSQPVLVETSSDQFLEANTSVVDYHRLNQDCIIPSFAKDNESTISHQDFIDATREATTHFFRGEQVLHPAIRVSHPIKGRIPEAKGKPANELLECEKTVYYERMAFVMDIPSITGEVCGNNLSLTVGGVRAYNHDNMHGRKTEERFKVFVGFKNWVCTNLCISTDGFAAEIRVRELSELFQKVYELLERFNMERMVQDMTSFGRYQLTEKQFAELIGRSRMYPYLPKAEQKAITPVPVSDTQISMVTREYYRDEHFSGNADGIDLWRLYNLFTGANKSSYIDRFLPRGVDAMQFVREIQLALDGSTNSWYLN